MPLVNCKVTFRRINALYGAGALYSFLFFQRTDISNDIVFVVGGIVVVDVFDVNFFDLAFFFFFLIVSLLRSEPVPLGKTLWQFFL